MKSLKVADLFCGAGGTSSGLIDAAKKSGRTIDLTAINHWDIAVATHSKNHGSARHLCASLDALNPRDLYGEDELDILWASPECTHHSIARGGKPIQDQSRATAWCVVRWAEALRPRIILVENVKEFLSWGPIDTKGRPIKSKRGDIFRSWVKNLEAIGYRVEWRILCAADYGDPTTRRRLFVQAVRGRRQICWPEPSHAPREESDLLGIRKPWVPARAVINWDKKGSSIYTRKKPLSEKTMRRIMIGLQRYGLRSFIIPQNRGGKPIHGIDDPVPVVATKGAHAIAQPFLVELRRAATARDLDDTITTVTAGAKHHALIEPYLIQTTHGDGKSGSGSRAKSVNDPLPTVAGNRGDFALCDPFIVSFDHGSSQHVRSANDPVSTVTTKQRHAVAEPFLVKYNGTGGAHSIQDPIDTVSTKPRYGLAQPVVEIDGKRFLVDILFRMLDERELARVQGFPDSYQFAGTKTEIVKQIGNAVPHHLAQALGMEAIKQL